MGPLGVTLAAILDEEAGNSLPHGAPICRNYLIVRGWTRGSDLTRFLQLPSAPHVRAHTSKSKEARCGRCLGLTEPRHAALLLDGSHPAEENVI